MKGHRPWLVAAGRVKLGAAYPVETDKYGRQAAPTTTGRASTARWSGSGKQDGKVYVRNQRSNAPQENPPARTWQIWAGQQRVSAFRRGELLGWLASSARRPRGKPAAYSWRGCRGIAGHLTRRAVQSERGNHPSGPLPPGMMLVGGKARRRLMLPGWDGGLVVVAGVTTGRGGRESRPQGEGVQQVRSMYALRGGRW
jgi:hypothetical protein